VTHPRHRERYAPARPGRRIFVVDDEANETRHAADDFVRIASGEHADALAVLRNRTAGRDIDASPALRNLAERVRASRFGIVFFGRGLTAEPVAHRAVEQLLRWVSELNDGRRFYARRLRRSGDVAGADSVLAWQTGYPFAVNFSRGYPRSNPGEFSGPEMLARGEVDACLLIGRATDLPAAAVERAEGVPLIAVESPGQVHRRPPAVQIFTADYGLHRPGTAYRMDEVAIPLRTILASELPSDADVLQRFL
jgi:formylmethanofuran dehydrogenase subunit B